MVKGFIEITEFFTYFLSIFKALFEKKVKYLIKFCVAIRADRLL